MFASYGFGLRKFSYFVCIGVTLLISSIDVSAASLTPTIHSLPTFGSWSDPNSWVEGRVPNSDDIVSIQGSIALDASYTVQGLVIEQGGLLSSSFATITSLGDIENNGAISIAGLISYGNITNSGGFSVAGLYLQGTGTSTLNFGNTTFTGTLALRTNISVIGDFKTTGQITLEGTNRTITLQDNHGITVGIGFYNGQLTVSGGTNSFLRTRGYTHTMIIDGNLDNFIFDGANSSLTPGDIYLCHGIITSKKATITEGSTLYHYPGCANSTIKTPLFHLEKDSLLDIRGGTYLFIEGGVFNEGSIFGGGGIGISGDIDNKSTWTAPTYISWNPYIGASSYNIVFSPGFSTGYTISGLSYDVTDKIAGQYYWQITPDNGESYPQRCINMGCVTGGGTPPTNTIPVPTNLTQQIRSQGQTIQTIQSGEKVGKYQSGSGVILSASGDTSISSRLVVDVYESGNTTPQEFSGGYSTDGNKTLTLSYLGAGSYRWKARVETASGGVSEWVDFGTNNPEEVDYILYEGFEPYPHGYKFPNSAPSNDILDGGIDENFWTGDRDKIDGNKWTIFNNIFPEYIFENKNAMLDAFEQSRLHKDSDLFQGGNCFGIATSSAIWYSHRYLLQQYFPRFSTKIGSSNVWHGIGYLHTNSSGQWDIYDDTIETILSFHLAQFDPILNTKMATYTEANTIYDILNNSNTGYILTIWGNKDNGLFSRTKRVGHTVIPYKVESFPDSKRIYIWDNNVPYAGASSSTAYQQYIEIDNNGTWTANGYGDWDSFDDISIISIDEVYNRLYHLFNGSSQSMPMGFNKYDMLATLNGRSDLTITDSAGRVSGFSGGTIMEDIPGVRVIVPLNATLTGTTDNTWKQIYLPQKQDGLTIKVSGKAGEQYDLMVAGGDYYTKIAGVTTSTGQIDTYTIAREVVEMDFDDTKTGTYSLLIDNFQDTLTGTVYLSNVRTSTGTEQYTISWTGVISGVLSAVQYTVDHDADGIDDLTLGLPAVYRDITVPTTTYTLSGELLAGTTSTYIESAVLSLTSLDDASGVGVDTIYYALGTDAGSLVYLPYTEPIVVNGVGTYTLHYYAVDNFGNQEGDISAVFTLVERPETHAGNISGYIYDDANQNGVRDPGEKGMAGWKVCIDTNNNTTCEENTEVFNISNNDGYYEFDSLITGVYSILEIPHQNWIATQPTTARYTINLTNGQRLQNQNFGNFKTKGSKK